MDTVLGFSNPPLEDVLEHYGVKGMKWGVRRSQAELDRAAGRVTRKRSRNKQMTVIGNSYAGNASDIRKARREVSGMRKDMRQIGNQWKNTSDPKQKAAFQKEYAKALHEYRTTHLRQRASTLTFGELGAIAILGTPMMAVGAFAVSQANVQRHVVRSGNHATAEMFKDKSMASKSYDQLMKEAMEVIEEAAEK